MIWVAKRRRNLFDIIIGRPKGYFDPRTWPKDWSDYGVGGTSPSQVKGGTDAVVKQLKSKDSE